MNAAQFSRGEQYRLFAATKKQGASNWFYEQEGSSRAAPNASIAPPPPVPMTPEFRARVLQRGAEWSQDTEPDLLALVAEEWWREDNIAGADNACRAATGRHVELARKIAAARDMPLIW